MEEEELEEEDAEEEDVETQRVDKERVVEASGEGQDIVLARSVDREDVGSMCAAFRVGWGG